MNIVIANKYINQINTLGLDTQNYIGIYDVNDIGNSFRTINYNNMIIDITAIKNYQDINTLKQLTNYLKPDSLIIILDPSCLNDEYIGGLVNIGIYNFAKDINELNKLINKKNNYNDVVGYQSTENINEYTSTPLVMSNTRRARIIGFENVTKHAGSSTLIYTLVKYLKKKYNVIGIEVDSTDFAFFKSKQLLSTISNKIRYIVDKNSEVDIIFIDVNGSNKAREVCDEIIYLVEPTTIKVNKLILAHPTIFQELFDKKIVLNRSLLSKWDIAEFENEARIKVFFNLPGINERNDKDSNIIKFINKLGFKI